MSGKSVQKIDLLIAKASEEQIITAEEPIPIRSLGNI
jgi:hypothetical protein